MYYKYPKNSFEVMWTVAYIRPQKVKHEIKCTLVFILYGNGDSMHEVCIPRRIFRAREKVAGARIIAKYDTEI